MSQEAAFQFAGTLHTSTVLQNQVQGLDLRQEANQKRFLKVAEQAGYTFTFNEWRAAIRTYSARQQEVNASTNELSEEQLNTVAGGSGIIYTDWHCTSW